MPKQQPPKENPLLSKNIPKPPAISTDQPVTKKEQNTVPSSTLQQDSKTVLDSNVQQSENTAKLQDTVKQQSEKAVQSSNTAKREKITFYLEPEQANKLYDFMEAFRKRTGIKINQQDLLRRIIDVITIDAVLP
jgi:C-terminal processing protease CtpA/Prc